MAIRDGGNTEKTAVHGVTQGGRPTSGEGRHAGSATQRRSPSRRLRADFHQQTRNGRCSDFSSRVCLASFSIFYYFFIRSIITDPNSNFKKLVNAERIMEIQSNRLQTAR